MGFLEPLDKYVFKGVIETETVSRSMVVETSERRGGAHMGFSRQLDAVFIGVSRQDHCSSDRNVSMTWGRGGTSERHGKVRMGFPEQLMLS